MAEKKMRLAVIDLGSNSIRLVIFEGLSLNPHIIFNEKLIVGLAKGLSFTGTLNSGAVDDAIMIISRYKFISDGFNADRLEILATAAVREASDGAKFLLRLQKIVPDTRITVLTGSEEGAISAAGVLLGTPKASGVIADLGGGSLELIRVHDGDVLEIVSLPVGTIRLGEMSNGILNESKNILIDQIGSVPWINGDECESLFLVGGGFRAFAKWHISETSYPLSVIHNYTIKTDVARNYLQKTIALKSRHRERMQYISSKRVDDLPLVSTIIRQLVRSFRPKSLVFSAHGLREGWYSAFLSESTHKADPVISASMELGNRWGRNDNFARALASWMSEIDLNLTDHEIILLKSATYLCDVGRHDHPDYRAEQSFNRILLQNGANLDHRTRAFLATTIAIRYDARISDIFIERTLTLLKLRDQELAVQIGLLFKLAFTLSAGIPKILSNTKIQKSPQEFILILEKNKGVFPGDAIKRRVALIGDALGIKGRVDFC